MSARLRVLVMTTTAALTVAGVRLADAEPPVTPVRVQEAWVAAAPAVSRVTAGYLRIENGSDREQVLVGAQSPLFARVEIHRSELRDGVARMVPVERLAIRPGETLAFEPGGYHLMLLDARAPLTAGASVPLSLEWADGGRTELSATVRPPGGPAHGHRHEH